MNTSLSNAERAEVLTHALPYIQKYNGKIIVVKYGGNAMISESLKEQVMEDIVLLTLVGVKVVLVHGGGPEMNDAMKKMGKEPVFDNGLRVTDHETMEIAQMVLAGKINKTLVNLLQTKGGCAMGISGMDPMSMFSPSWTFWIKATSRWYPHWAVTGKATHITSMAIPQQHALPVPLVLNA